MALYPHRTPTMISSNKCGKYLSLTQTADHCDHQSALLLALLFCRTIDVNADSAPELRRTARDLAGFSDTVLEPIVD